MTLYRPHLIACGLLALAWLVGLPAAFADLISDKRFLWPKRPASETIALVEIDAPSLARIGVWPWPRRHHAKLIEQLETAGATEILFDVDFSARSNPVDDAAFAEALAKAGGSVVLPTFQQRAGDLNRGLTLHVNRPLPEFAAQSWSAVVNVLPETDGLVRRYGLGARIGEFLPSFGALLVGRHDEQGAPFRIDFSIGTDTVPAVSYIAVLDGEPQALARLKGRKVIVAGTAVELGDRFNVPNGRVIPGSMLQLLAAESLLQGRALQSTGLPLSLVGIVAILVGMVVLWRRTSARARVAIVLWAAASLEVGAFLIQTTWPIIVDTSSWLLLLGAYLIAIALHEIDLRGLLRGIAERRFQRIAMSLGDGLVCLDDQGRIVFWNPGAAKIFGYPEADALDKPFTACLADPEQLARLQHAAAVDDHILDLVGLRRNGERFALEASASSWQGTDGRQFGLVLRDITIKQRERERIRYLAEHDDLTGLLNRHTLGERLAAEFDKGGAPVSALILIGIDRFHHFSDIHGREFADQVLVAFAARLRALMPADAEAARFADDEFALIAPKEFAAAVANDVARDFGSAALVFGEWRQRVAVRIGYAVAEPGWSADHLIGNAHLALEAAILARDEQPIGFAAAMRDRIASQLALEAELRLALEKNQFELFYQPQVLLSDRSVIGAEALIRWRHPVRGLIPPGQFIPVLNNSPLSDAVANWVLATACQQSRQWQLAGTPVRVGVNLSPSQLQGSELQDTVAALLDETGLAPELLELEVTEDILIEDAEKAQKTFREIRARGVKIAFDDFGTGYGSLSYLKAFPLDTLKIDQTFVRQLLNDSGDAAIVRATIDLGRSLGLSIIAEGIEDLETANRLKGMGCDEGQGYHFGRPLSAPEFEQLFLARRSVA
ncbi:PAS domain S-box-containing protein/diguanylate cyclase (GGDEF) domain-containing protein [Bosea lupini]|uniref:PAS domain S-box-containing protein/diguanylate cyclase (GGDEF) domain-containing protein n=1 Tax=Bosea lupini TaxID=1036779 RepID=A0A1H7TZI7_9HYPH|nr:EAL domain-containing protein [Bosea lupini]SEL89848.1 PAS domain S-box-containing protein/diguanylate cyclase (GGDEF) domain-containing protein [Bosea lupini]